MPPARLLPTSTTCRTCGWPPCRPPEQPFLEPATWARAAGLDATQIDDVALAAYEAMADVVDHAYDVPGGVFDLHACRQNGLVIVTDHGRFKHPPDGARSLRGRGLLLIERAALEFEPAQHHTQTGDTEHAEPGTGANLPMAAADQPLAEHDLVTELRAVGVAVNSVWDLVNTRSGYPDAVPVLVMGLRRVAGDPDNARLVEGIARALSVKQARPAAAPALIECFDRVEDESVRWAMGSALDIVADKSSVSGLLELAGQSRYGSSRQLVVSALGRVGKDRPEVVELLVRLLGDDDMAAVAASALARLKAVEAREPLRPLLKHDRPHVRKTAKTALRKLDTIAEEKE